ncbi:hypothetical protein ACFQ4K_15355 [Tistrella bauzanensis]
MWHDIIELRNFYQSRSGRIAQRLLRRDLRRIWPRVGPGETLLGLGYATPFLRPFLGEAGRVVAAMPAPRVAMSGRPRAPIWWRWSRNSNCPIPTRASTGW